MENSSTMIGPRGIIRRHEFVRVVLQCLYSLGYKKSASCLESESGILYKSVDFKELELQVFNGNWDGCVHTLNAIMDLKEDIRASVMFLVFKQCLLEYLNSGDDCLALNVLRKQVPSFRMSKEKVHKLASSILWLEEMELGKIDKDAISELRKDCWWSWKNCFLRQSQYLQGGAVSLYVDHCCDRDLIPTETVQILTEHKNEVWFVQFSNNGEYLASSSSDCTAIIWKVGEDSVLTLKHTLRSHQNPVSFVAWSPDDTKLLTCGNLEVLKLWNVETGICKHTFGEHGFIVSSCAWFPDSKRLVCGSSDPEKGIFMWDCDGNEIKAWRGTRMPKVLDLAVTPDGKILISVLSDKEIRVLNLGTNAERVISEEHPITSLSVSVDSKFFIVNLNSQEIHLWDIAGKLEKPLKYTGHQQNKYVIRSCFGGLDSSFIASGSENSQVYIWNKRNTKPIEVLTGHLMTVNCVSWNPKRPQMLASASDDQSIRIWGPSQSNKSSI
ncbi:hypothetical protein LWI29_016057 [Acer saccharum]|uniref:CTLH domain-containing protein n=1 Tax=Acer saccharum TaxID=4024 RepID=A0AA39S241_ACESA|nr:hypothetical protein LWI29_016057 [Acer saccharum]